MVIYLIFILKSGFLCHDVVDNRLNRLYRLDRLNRPALKMEQAFFNSHLGLCSLRSPAQLRFAHTSLPLTAAAAFPGAFSALD